MAAVVTNRRVILKRYVTGLPSEDDMEGGDGEDDAGRAGWVRGSDGEEPVRLV